MNFVKYFSWLGTSLSVIVLSTSINAATITYNWAGADGTGAITFLDTNITDSENFTVAFDTENVANISYTFNNGASIEDAENFSGGSTLQAIAELGGAMFTASDGVIEDWTFNYDTVQSILPLDIWFSSSLTTGSISCFTTPCPVDTATINFIGNFSSETNVGTWQLQAVPLPAAVWLFVSGFVGLLGFSRVTSRIKGTNQEVTP